MKLLTNTIVFLLHNRQKSTNTSYQVDICAEMAKTGTQMFTFYQMSIHRVFRAARRTIRCKMVHIKNKSAVVELRQRHAELGVY